MPVSARSLAGLQRVLAIAHVSGGLPMVIAATCSPPIASSIDARDGATDSFIEAGSGTLVLGWVLIDGDPRRLHRRRPRAMAAARRRRAAAARRAVLVVGVRSVMSDRVAFAMLAGPLELPTAFVPVTPAFRCR